jgi:AraC-like DNA-binding protein
MNDSRIKARLFRLLVNIFSSRSKIICTPRVTQILLEKRILKKLLRDPLVRIEDVALSVGFDDQSNFTRMFRRIGGLNPGAFRKAAQC